MAALLSPLQIQASSGLLQNQGLDVATALTASINLYNSQPPVGTLIAAIQSSSSLPPSTQQLLQTFANTSCPALADSIVPSTVAQVTSTLTRPGMSGIVELTADLYLGNGDLSKFTQNLTAANSYCSSTNTFIDSAVNSANYLGATFTGMDNLVTGGLTEINLATQAMGSDLYNAGQYIDLGNLANYGTPLALIQQISRRAGTISPMIAPLINAGVDERIVLGINDPSVAVTDSVQKLMYDALTTVTGDDLASILRILDVWTPNITSLADLLNPAIMLPNSYQSLTVPTPDGTRGIFIAPYSVVSPGLLTAEESKQLLEQEAVARTVPRPLACELRQSEDTTTTATGTGPGVAAMPNSNLESRVAADQVGVSYERLSAMTNPSLALVNKAYACALGQVTNISRMTLPQLSAAFLAAETNKDLPLIEQQTQAVPQATLDYYQASVATGSGVNGTILLTDVLGTAVGTNITSNLNNCVAIIDTMYNAGQLGNLITIYNDIYANTLVSDAGNVNALIGVAQTEIIHIKNVVNPAACAELNTYFSAISAQITKETGYQTKAGMDVVNSQGNNQLAIQSFVLALPGYGLDTKVGGAAQYIEDVAVVGSSAGQAIVATLREGRTTAGLNAAGVGTAGNAVESTPSSPSPQATLIPSQYSQAQAQARVVY